MIVKENRARVQTEGGERTDGEGIQGGGRGEQMCGGMHGGGRGEQRLDARRAEVGWDGMQGGGRGEQRCGGMQGGGEGRFIHEFLVGEMFSITIDRLIHLILLGASYPCSIQ